MSPSADVKSFHTLTDIKITLQKFALIADAALCEIDLETRRMIEWLMHDQLSFWKSQVRRATDKVAESRINVLRCRTNTLPGGRRPDCSEEEKILMKAQRRLEHSEKKVVAVKRWSKKIEDDSEEYRGQVTPLYRLLELEMPKAQSALEHMLRSLESYQTLSAPTRSQEPESVAREAVVGAGTVARKLDQDEVSPYVKLRSLTPDRATYVDVELEKTGMQIDEDELFKMQQELIAQLEIEGSPVGPNDKVVVAKGCLALLDNKQQKIYLERLEIPDKVSLKDISGWYLGPVPELIDVQDNKNQSYEAFTVGELFRQRPTLAKTMALRAGFLAVVAGGTVLEVLDQKDKSVLHVSQKTGG